MRFFLTLTLASSVPFMLLCQAPCPNVHDTNNNNTIDIQDFLSILGLFQDIDTDLDGIWDSEDLCVDFEACNYYAVPSLPCEYFDVLGNCGGDCNGDADNDGICDDIDDCVGVVDECGICGGNGAESYLIDSIYFNYDSVYLPLEDDWYVFVSSIDTTFLAGCPPSDTIPPTIFVSTIGVQPNTYSCSMSADQILENVLPSIFYDANEPVEWTFDIVPMNLYCPFAGDHWLVISAVDSAGNESSYFVEDLLSIVDSYAPIFFGDIPTYNNGTSALPCGDPLPEITSIQAADECSDVTISYSETFEGDSIEGTFGVFNWVVEAFDCAGNSTQYTTNFIVNDPAPVIQVEQPIGTINCSGEIPHPVFDIIDCGEVEVSTELEIIGDSSGCNSPYVARWFITAIDAIGNVAVDSVDIVITP